MDRVDSTRWGPRAVDIDILVYDDLVLDEGMCVRVDIGVWYHTLRRSRAKRLPD